jgi:hypothetical protein
MELSREVAQIFDSQHAPPPPASIECKNKKKNFPVGSTCIQICMLLL